MLTLESQALRTIRLERMLKAGERVLVALSGGADSVALLLTLLTLRRRLGLDVRAGHVNHRLRGADSDADQVFAAELCERLGVPFQTRDLPDDGVRRGNLEQRLRRARYQALFEMAVPDEAAVATGHTLDDQAETFLMKLARGAGPTGLGGVFPVRRNKFRHRGVTRVVKVVRPLIDCRRDQIEAYLTERGQTWREDASNLDPALDRNWVRHRLLPEMQRRLNPSVVEHIGRSAGLLREIDRWLKRRAKAAYRHCLASGAEDPPGLSVDRLARLPAALAKETVRLAILRARGSLTGVSQRNVADVLAISAGDGGKRVDLPGGWRAWREYGLLRVRRAAADYELELTIPGEIFVYQTRRRVIAERGKAGEARPGRSSPPTKEIWLRLPGDRLTVRNRRPGDRMLLDGRSEKLKDLMQRRRVPLGKRDSLSVFESGGLVAGVEEIGADDRFRPSSGEPAAVRITVVRETFEGGEGSNKQADADGFEA